MRIILTILLFAFAAKGYSQQFTPLRDQIPSNASILQVGHNIVLLHPLNEKNQSHKWVSFDSSLNILSAKKLVSPDWESMVSQSYFAIKDAVIRIDQLIYEDSLYISLFRFDALGNITQKLELDHLPVTRKKLEPLVFYIAVSADKKMLALVQPRSEKKDELTISAIVVNDTLGLMSNAERSYPYDMLVMDMLPPLVSVDGNVFVPVVDKFTSYRLGTELKLLPVSADGLPHEEYFDRNKLKDVRLRMTADGISLSALYSVEENKSEVAGVMYGQWFWNPKMPERKFHPYDEAMKKALSKKIGTIGRKGNPLNYLYMLPARQLPTGEAYGVLLTESIPGRIHNTPKVANASAELDKVKRQVATVNSLVGTRRRRDTGPTPGMTYAEASTQAAMMERTIGDRSPGMEPESAAKNNELPEPKKDNSQHLLYFSHGDSTINYQFLKFRIPTEPFYEFFAFAEIGGMYHAIHYNLQTLNRPQLISTTVGADGKALQKVLLENKQKLLIEGYPTLVFHGKKLIAVYEDRKTGEMGVVGVPLQYP